MNLTKNGMTISVDDVEVTRLVLERLAAETIPTHIVHTDGAPKIGDVWSGQGGIYAGVARGRDGGADYHLIAGSEFDGSGEWAAMLKWATSLKEHGFADYGLPYRKEQALLFANVPELFQPEAYWSCEQHASNGDCAWGQYFGNGLQDYWLKGYKFRARAVRRLIIQ